MKVRKIYCLVFSLAAMFAAPPAHAQWPVFDATNYLNAVREYHELQQAYTTALETRDQIIAAYNLAYQMSRMPQNLAQRYKSNFAQWTNLSAPDAYGNTSAWINALDLGGLPQAAEAYNHAVIQAAAYPNGSYSSLDPNSQAVVANQYATSELAQGTITSTLATLGAIRSNSQTFSQKLSNLEADTFAADPSQQTEMSVLGKINTANLLQVHSQQDTNQILAASAEQQLIAQKQQIDAQNRALNQAIYFLQNFPALTQRFSAGVSDSIHRISLSPGR